jgi:hypothetical protein
VTDATVGELAGTYLGNILYALERCALSLEAEGNTDGAAYYRGLARALAEARGAEKRR